MAMLAHDWMSGEMRFDDAGEALFAAMMDGRLAGVGGVSRDPYTPDPYTPDGSALRMRRLYVRPQSRRCGVGRALAGAMIDHAGVHARLLTVNAAASKAAPLFWDAMGFAVEPQPGRTHTLRL